ncbi:MAG: S1 RNA-binding domain-containing protein [Pseudobdellovibrionaceae bacterium]
MSKKDLFGDEVIETKSMDDFGAMFAASEGASQSAKVGDTKRGEILSIGKDETFVSIGLATDGMLPTRDLLDDQKQIKYKIGDYIDVIIVKMREGDIRLTKKGAKSSSADLESLEDAFDMELPVEGKVTETCNGGFRVNVQGKTAFCPISQMDLRTSKEASDYVGKKFDFVITQLDEKGRNIVVSRRKLLEMQRAEFEGEFINLHKEGDILNGVITRLERFGAFVELQGGIEGLIHISELAWSRTSNPAEVVQPGLPVSVKILKVEEDAGRLKISLSLKQAGGEGDPWMMVPSRYPVGSSWTGTVEKKENFGLFVNIGPGVTGLLPRSKWRESTESAQYENKKKGDTVQVQVGQIQFEEKRISLGLPSEAVDESWKQHSGSSSATSGLGTFADLLKNAKPAKK